MPDRAKLHPVNRAHLEVLTDRVGIMQHAIGSRPDPAHGYCVDDVARALEVDLLHGRSLGWAAVADSAARGLRFIAEAFHPASGRFRNFRSVDGSWVGGIGSEDSHGRAVLALGTTVGAAPDRHLVDVATTLLVKALPATRAFTSPRAEGSVVLGCAAALATAIGGPSATTLEVLAARLHERFGRYATADWPWPEGSLTYENAVLPRALIVAGERLGYASMTATGLGALDWLIDIQTSNDGHLSAIGNGWWPRGGERSRFDQQPIEATALILAAGAAYGVTRQVRYRDAMERSYAWFLGANDLGLAVADPERGACGDGLTAHGVNTNEGAESTLMWLIASEHIRAARSAAELARRPARPADLLATPIA